MTTLFSVLLCHSSVAPFTRRVAEALDETGRLDRFEAPMLGACYLTEWAPGLDQLYELEQEVAIYRDAPELAAQIARLLADPAQRRQMRAAAQRRALQTHTIGPTLEKISSALGLGTDSRRLRFV